MIIELNYKPHRKDEENKIHRAKSLVECANCQKQREISRYSPNLIKDINHHCQKCSTILRTYNIEDYLKLGKEKGFVLISDKVTTSKDKVLWQCKNLHIWESTFLLISQGYGCPYCARCAPKTIEDYKKLAQEKGFEFLENNVVNVGTYQKWRCSCGEIWITSFQTVSKSEGCRKCWNKRIMGSKNHMWIEDRRLAKTRKQCFKVCRGFITRCLNNKNDKTYNILGYTAEELRLHIESTWEFWMNWDNYGKYYPEKQTWQIDHIKPIAQFFEEGINDAKIINALSNLRALETKENLGRCGRSRVNN